MPDNSAEPEILTKDTVAGYVTQHAAQIGVFPPDTALAAEAIQGGNVNFAFRVHSSDGTAVFVKQAPEYVAIFGPDGLPLTSTRIQKEVAVLRLWASVFGEEAAAYLPQLHYFDNDNRVFVMEFLEGFTLLDHRLVARPAATAEVALGTQLGSFMAKTHLATHSSRVSPDRAGFFAREYENRALRDIQLEYVFTKAYKETSAHTTKGFAVDAAFLAEIEALKARYNGEGSPSNLALCHGDLHPGSVMVKVDGDDAQVRVIDPEFTIYGPPGLDVGSLLSGYILAAVHQSHAHANEGERATMVLAIAKGIAATWDAYRTAMAAGGIAADALRETETEAVGYAAAEVCRTALGFAGGRLWLQFDEPAKKEAAVQAALAITRRCMMARREEGMQALVHGVLLHCG